MHSILFLHTISCWQVLQFHVDVLHFDVDVLWHIDVDVLWFSMGVLQFDGDVLQFGGEV